MFASKFINRIRRLLLPSLRPFLWRAALLAGVVAMLGLGACGKSMRDTTGVALNGSQSAEEATTDNGTAVEDGQEAESAESELENEAANEREFNAAVASGEIRAEYVRGETPASATAGETVVLVGAGDIATSGSGDSQTAKLIQSIAGTVFTAGDNAYSDGSASNFSSYYAPTWGAFKSRTRPSPGNHDYKTSGAKGYYDYFGSVAGPSGRGYYSYNIGDWHIISLNSNISMSTGSTQEKWLRADLAANTNRCALAYWHHPRFSSGEHGNNSKSTGVWKALTDYGAEIVVTGHDHNYERFAPMMSDGRKDLAKGLRSFVVGTGGTSLRSMSSTKANSEKRSSSARGVIKFTLAPGSYKWEFIPVAGKTFTDAGSGTCH